MEEFYLAPAVKGTEEDVPSHVYATSGKYIDSVSVPSNLFWMYQQMVT